MKKIVFFICLFLSINLYSQEKRLALVIGNSAYEHGGVLPNPINDAYAMTEALSDVGFEVQAYYNLNQGDLKKAIDDFGIKLRNFDVGLFFYAGHGIQSDGYNYLIPIDANLINERQVEYDCVKADRILAFMESSNSKVNIVILDACRNNPFERSWNRTATGKGLAFMDAPTGTLIAYATAPGSTASDGIGKNGLYTDAILESIKIPNITALEMFQSVRTIVSEKSNNQQIPWESTSLTGDFYFIQGFENNVSHDSYPSQYEDVESSPGTSTVDIGGYKLTYKKHGNKKPRYLGWPKDIYIDNNPLTTSDILDILSEANHPMYDLYKDYYYIRWIGATMYYSSFFLIPAGAIGMTFEKDEQLAKQYSIFLYTGAGFFVTGVVLNRISKNRRDKFLKYTFPNSFSSIEFGLTNNGIGIAYKF